MLISPEIQVFLLSMSPIGELRASIPLGIALFNMPWDRTLFISIIGNTLAVTIVLLYMEKATNYLSSRSNVLSHFLNKLFNHTRKKYEKRFKIWKELALVSLVAIPLPFTGGWTGALCAFLFGVPNKKAIPLLGIGISLAGIITTLCTLGIIKIAFLEQF